MSLLGIDIGTGGTSVVFAELAGNPVRTHTYLDRLTDIHLADLKKYLSTVGESLDLIGFGDDLYMQTDPQISLAAYREIFKPGHATLWNAAKKLCPGIQVSLQCVVVVYPLLRDISEAGLYTINLVQFTCTDMKLACLKREFGRYFTFWGGGCDTRSVLVQGTPEEVSRHLTENVRIKAKGGGFVFQ